MFLHQFGVILASSFSVLSAFPVGFLGGICAFLGHFCVSEALFLKINFVQHWQSLSAAQNYSSKIHAPQNFSNKSKEDILWMPFLHQPPTHSLP